MKKTKPQKTQVSSPSSRPLYILHKTVVTVFWSLSSFSQLRILEVVFVKKRYFIASSSDGSSFFPSLSPPAFLLISHLKLYRVASDIFLIDSSSQYSPGANVSSCSDEFSSEWSEESHCSVRLHHPWIILHWGGGWSTDNPTLPFQAASREKKQNKVSMNHIVQASHLQPFLTYGPL